MEPFLKDVVDFDADRGEPWVIGYRQSTYAKSKEKKPESRFEQVGEKVDKPEGKKIPVVIWLRRVPQEVDHELGISYRSERTVKDTMGNERIEHYFKPEHLDEMIRAKALWMWRDVENFYVEVGDKAGVDMYSRAMFGNGGPPGEGSGVKGIKVGENIKLDGKLTEEVKEHLIKRFRFIQTEIMKAYNKFQSAEAHKEELLRGNL